MRIVYDDCKQQRFVEIIECFMERLNPSSISEYDYGMERVQPYRLRKMLDLDLHSKGFEIGKNAVHDYGIGNNCRHPVYYHEGTEVQQCAFININRGMFSEVYVSIEDYRGKIIGHTYKIHPNHITIEF